MLINIYDQTHFNMHQSNESHDSKNGAEGCYSTNYINNILFKAFCHSKGCRKSVTQPRDFTPKKNEFFMDEAISKTSKCH